MRHSEHYRKVNMYKNKKTGQIGRVVHLGITTTLRFDDGSEVILTPANLRADWVKFDNRFTEKEFTKLMREWNTSHDQTKATLSGVIVYDQSNFGLSYTEDQRSYRVWNNNPIYQLDAELPELMGDCLDGTDDNVCLDIYDWKVEFCYFE